MNILVTGATGYIGGRLVPCLLEAGHRVRCFARHPAHLAGYLWSDRVEAVQGDVLEKETILPALEGIEIAYYLIHSLYAGQEFAERDRQAARNFGEAAKAAGVKRIIYLGGIQPKGARSSEHLQSRIETGDRLREAGVPVTEFRAAVIVGSGSISFEMIRYLTERVPVMICPRWVDTPTQPIAVRDVLAYLVEALRRPESAGRVLEIGGSNVLTYADMFRLYASVRKLDRPVIRVPFLTPRLSSLWVGLVTPINYAIARLLIAGLGSKVVVTDPTARQMFDVDPISYEAAVRLALQRYSTDTVETVWHGAYSTIPPRREGVLATEFRDEQGLMRDRRQLRVQARPSTVFRIVKGIGGDTGWLYANTLWRIRGLLDELVGGIGLQRGRRSSHEVRMGDAIDFWRVDAMIPDKLLRLRAEMKLPGKAWLQFEVEPAPDKSDTTLVTQTAFFEPRGLPGVLYWYLFLPAHLFLFPGMIKELGRRSRALEAEQAAAQATGQPGPLPA